MKLTAILLCAAVAANVVLYATANEMEEECQENEFGDAFQDNVADLDDQLDLADLFEAALNNIDDLNEENFERNIDRTLVRAIMKSADQQGAFGHHGHASRAARIVKPGEAAYDEIEES